jgi:histone-lysine N-methyltransferase SETD2
VLKLDESSYNYNDMLRIKRSKYVDFIEPANTRREWADCDCKDSLFCCMEQCELAAKDIECHVSNHGGMDCGNQRLQRQQYAPSYLKETKDKGMGLYASSAIEPNQLIAEYIGEVINEKTLKKRSEN